MLTNGIAGGLTLISVLMIVGGTAVAISLLIENLKFKTQRNVNRSVQASSEKEHTVSV